MNDNIDKETANDSRPWVTFCMTTYKRPEFLKKQLNSILQQTFSDFQIVISDNDPMASAEAVVKQFNDPRIFYSVNEENLGMVKSFNRSLARANSEYVVMITDDDPVYPDMLQTLHDLSVEHPGFGMYIGGCDIVCLNPVVAKSMRLRVGTNSCLADLPVDMVRKYSGEEFPFAYFKGELGCHLLWSTGIVKRDIALAIEGMPDFGAPYNTDIAYIVLAGSYEGVILLNTSLGCQVVHGGNYGFTESDFNKLYITPDGFYQWIMKRLPKNHNYEGLKTYIETFTARWVVEYSVSIHKFIKHNKIDGKNFRAYVDKVFKIPYLRVWRAKFFMAINFPGLFESLVALKKRVLPAKVRSDAKV